MRKLSLLFALLIFAVGIIAQNDSGSSRTASANLRPSDGTVKAISGQPKSAETAEQNPPSWGASVKWAIDRFIGAVQHHWRESEWWLVVIALGTGLAIAYQAREMTSSTKAVRIQARIMRRQARIMARQTKVLEAQANVLINSERAWIMIESTYTPKLAPSPGARPTLNEFRFNLRNGGKTVAKLLDFKAEFHILERGMQLVETPVYQGYWNQPNERTASLQPVHGSVMAPDEVVRNISHQDAIYIGGAQFEEIERGNIILCVYGLIRYFDFADVERRFQFCYRYVPSGIPPVESVVYAGESQIKTVSEKVEARWTIFGPRDYNTHT